MDKFLFLTSKKKLLVSCLENSNVFLNFFFSFSSSSIEKSLLQDGKLYSIKLLLIFLYSRKQFQFLHLRLCIPVKLSARLDSDVDINLMQSMNFILYDINLLVLLPSLSIFFIFIFYFILQILFYWDRKGLTLLTIFCNTVKLTIEFMCQSFDDQTKIILRSFVKNYRDFIGHVEF